jgi:uncharacterized alkaline shock family protein YloU
MPEHPVAGKSIVTRRAIVDIVRTAVQGSYGVIGFSDPSLGRRLLRWIGLDRPGIQLGTENGLYLDVYIRVANGVPVAEVARQVDSAVRYSVGRLIGVEVTGLRIHVDGLGYQPGAIERAEAIERASSDLAAGNGAGEQAAVPAKPARPRTRAPRKPAEAKTAPRRRKAE